MPQSNFFKEKYKLAREVLIGHEAQLAQVLEHLEISAAGLNDPTRPIGAFLLAGPTGCGKTTFAKAIAYALHKSKEKLLRIDCAEFQQDHEVAKLLGAPPGYLGHRETASILGQAQIDLRASDFSPVSIILFDEIEKAAPSFSNLLLGVLDNATLTLGSNQTAKFNNCLILMTSNQGVKETTTKLNYGFTPTTLSEHAKEHIIRESIARHFSPEFRNRLDGILVMKPLTHSEVREVARHELQNAFKRATVNVVVNESVIDKLVEFGYSSSFGARQIKRIIDTKLIRPAARLILTNPNSPTPLMIDTTSTGFSLHFIKGANQ